MTILPIFRGWVASLSNGDTYLERPPVPGERTSWQNLITYLNQNNLRITSFKLVRGDFTIQALPRKVCDGYYQAYEFRKMVFRDTEVRLQGIGSIVGDKVYITWLDEMGNVSMDIRNMSSEYIHTTLRDSYVNDRDDDKEEDSKQ